MFTFQMPPLDWRKVKIPKKSGGFRDISIPNDELKEVQRSILTYLYNNRALRPSAFAHGFVPYRNTCTGAMRHDRKAEVILCMDVKDFFDNFPVEPVRKRLLEGGIGYLLVEDILKACMLEGAFPQGSPCSPYLTNVGMFEVDLLLSAYAKNKGFSYSRYADDITLARLADSPVALKKNYKNMFYGVEKILQSRLGLQLNHKKDHEIWLRGSEKRRITGVVIRKDGLGYNAPKAMRKTQRAATYNLAKKLEAQSGIPLPEDFASWQQLYGYVQYFDYIRSYSDQEAATADPCIQTGPFEYLCSIFKPIKKENTQWQPTQQTNQTPAPLLPF